MEWVVRLQGEKCDPELSPEGRGDLRQAAMNQALDLAGEILGLEL